MTFCKTLLFLLVCSLASGLSGAAFDALKGSHERHIESIENAHEQRYRAIIEAYDAWCEQHPADVIVALERVRFVEYFLYSEELYIETADADHERALAFLESHFSDQPEMVLYQLEQAMGEDFFALARKHRDASVSWTPEQRGRYHFLLARTYAWQPDPTKALAEARRSFEAHVTIEIVDLLSRLLMEQGYQEECIEMLRHPVYADAEPWMKKQKLDRLLSLKQVDDAVELYDELKDNDEVYLDYKVTAQFFVEQGRIEDAREVIADVELTDWNRTEVLRERFNFETEHGSAMQAYTAYNALRDEGLAQDPFLCKRVMLARKHSGLPWQWRDLLGLLSIGGLIVVCLVLPLFLLVPIHYWGLLREQAGKVATWQPTPWGLRHAWLFLAVMTMVDVGALWFFDADTLASFFIDDFGYLGETMTNDQLLLQFFITELVWFVVAVLFLVFSRNFSLLWTENWSIGRCIGVGFGWYIVFRILANILIQIFPESQMVVSQGSPMVAQLSTALLEQYGPFFLILFIGVIGPVLEEFVFRGLLLSAFSKHTPFWFANILQAVLFLAVHEDYHLAPFYFLFAIVCGVMFKKSNGLFAPIVLHVINNTLVCVGVIILDKTF